MPDDTIKTPTADRIQDLLHIWRVEIMPGPHSVRDPGSYHSWDDLLEFPEHQDYGEDCAPMTTEEWEWCRDNFKVEVRTAVAVKGSESRLSSSVITHSDPDDGWIAFDDEQEGEGITFSVDEAAAAFAELCRFLEARFHLRMKESRDL